MAIEEGDRDIDAKAKAKQNEEHGRSYDELWQWAHGRDVIEVEQRLREFSQIYAPYVRESDIVIQARVMSDVRWGVEASTWRTCVGLEIP